MEATNSLSGNFAVEDIRRVRNAFDRRHTDESGNYDWDGAAVEIEVGAAAVRTEIARLRSGRERGQTWKTRQC
jgi:hypothetical protein